MLAIAHKFSRYTFLELLDKQESFKNAQKKLISYHQAWREETKATHGGITAHHRELVWALLKILPVAMEYYRENHPRRFKNFIRDGRYMLTTTRKTLLKKMADEAISVGSRTIYNLLDRLEAAGIIVSRRVIQKVGIEIELNPQIISLYMTKEEAMAATESPNFDLEIGNIQTDAEIGEEQDIQAGGEPAPLDEQINSPQNIQEEALSDDTPQISRLLPPYINQNTENLKENKEEMGKVLAIANGDSMFKQEIRSGGSATEITTEMLLVAQLLASVFNNSRLSESDHRSACELIGTHLEAARGIVTDWRGALIRQVKESKAYQNAKQKDRFLLNFQKKLPDVDRRAFEIVSMAINIQSDYLKRIGYNLYMHPCKYLATGFYKSMAYSRDEMMKQFEHPINNAAYHAHCLVRSELLRAVSNVSLVYKKEGAARALEAYSNHYGKLVALMNSEECKTFTGAHRETYLNRLQNQLKHLIK
jgi:hypothetical protein